MSINNKLFRFTTAGNVDDGKSTLIGRLLYDSKSLFEDQLEAVEHTSRRKGLKGIDLAMFTDGLRDEREQGITIDVAYRYFTTEKRKFIIADTPGHIEYTRNMITGASTADAVLILLDARNGISEQTRRHTFIAQLLNIRQIIVCVNKMDLVDYSETVFQKLSADFQAFSNNLQLNTTIHLVPTSALNGDNVVNHSTHMEWYNGPSLLEVLETINTSDDLATLPFRFPVQTILRRQTEEYPDFRAYAGRIDSGVIYPGSELTVFPSGQTTRVKAIHFNGKQLESAYAPMSVSITTENDVDISRGDLLADPNASPQSLNQLSVMLCWLGNQEFKSGIKYLLKHTTNEVTAVISHLDYKLDINTLNQDTQQIDSLRKNEICKAQITTNSPVTCDPYNVNRGTGSFILIDPANNETIAAGMIRS